MVFANLIARGPRMFARAIGLGAAGTLAALVAQPVAAAVIESYSIANSYGYSANTNDTEFDQVPGGAQERVVSRMTTGGSTSEIGINYDSYVNDTGFYFLHQNYCAGTCATASQSVVTITIQNTGDAPVDLRFDSQITAGHLAYLNPSAGTSGQFYFSVDQSFGDDSDINLYSASGSVSQSGISLDTGGLTYNGLQTISPPESNYSILDWGATNLNLDLAEIPAGGSTTLTYTASYYVSNDGTCDTVATCSAAEIAFGDPRNKGGVTLSRQFLADLDPIVYEPVVGGSYASGFVPFSVVDSSAPLPSDPPAKADVIYIPEFASQAAVPEPATWASMIVGLGAIGAAMRRRRKDALTAD